MNKDDELWELFLVPREGGGKGEEGEKAHSVRRAAMYDINKTEAAR